MSTLKFQFGQSLPEQSQERRSGTTQNSMCQGLPVYGRLSCPDQRRGGEMGEITI